VIDQYNQRHLLVGRNSFLIGEDFQHTQLSKKIKKNKKSEAIVIKEDGNA
jgi:hypothetical protein